jgi:hypothetical protein
MKGSELSHPEKTFLSLSGGTSIMKGGIPQTEPREWCVLFIRQDENWKKMKRKMNKAKK